MGDLVVRLESIHLALRHGGFDTDSNLMKDIMCTAARIQALESALEKVATMSPAVTHGWAVTARNIARKALEGLE